MSLLCHRCGAILTPGSGDFFEVHIDAVADPTTVISAEDMQGDPAQTIQRLMQEMNHLSEQELMDTVHRHLTLHLCRRCFTPWIEDPASKP